MKIFRSVYLILIAFFTITGANAQIKLKIENLKSDSVLYNFVKTNDKEITEEGSVLLKDGVLTLEIPFEGMQEVKLLPISLIPRFKNGLRAPLPGSMMRFYAHKGDQINITAKIVAHSIIFEIAGNSMAAKMAKVNSDKLALFEERYALDQKFHVKKEAEQLPADFNAYLTERRKINSKNEAKNIVFIKQNPKEPASAAFLLDISNKDSVMYLYPKLSNEVKESYFGKLVGNNIKAWMASEPGKVLPDFQTTTILGKPFQLSAYRGKYVLLDFWGSWCGPCLSEIPQLKALEKQNADQLTVIGLICKDQKKAAAKIIADHQLTSVQLFDPTIDFGAMFGIRDYPTKILIDGKGKVVKVFTGSSDQNFKEIQTLVNK